MAGEERGAGRHYGTVDRVESLGSGSGYGRGVYGRGSRGYNRGRGFGRHYGRDSWGSDRNHDRVGDGRELRGTNTSNSRGIASNSRSRGSASNSYRVTDRSGSYINYMGEASNSRSNGSNSSNYRDIARNSGSSTSNSRESVGQSRGSADDYVDFKSKGVIETGEVYEDSLRMTSTMESFEYVLPVEHWMQVLENVPSKDLCNVALTSRYMNSLATSPELWTRTEVSKWMVKVRGLAQFFNVNRFKKIKQIDFSLMDLSKTERMRLINDIPESPLQKVNFSGTDLHKVPAKTLSKAVAHLKMVNLEDTRLTTSQLIKILEAILSSEFLQDVNLAWNDLHDKGKGPVDLLRLQKVNLSGTSLNAGQCERLVEAIFSSGSLLDVNLRGNRLSGVSADLLARAVSRLKRVSLACADLSKVSADLLASVVSLLQKVDLSWTKLTADQSAKVVDAIISSNSLVEVSLAGINLSQVPADLLAKAVGALKAVNLKWTKLTAYQSSIVVAIVSSNSFVAVTL